MYCLYKAKIVLINLICILYRIPDFNGFKLFRNTKFKLTILKYW